jgi:RNA polymerase sigma factor (sigma-70 family)
MVQALTEEAMTPPNAEARRSVLSLTHEVFVALFRDYRDTIVAFLANRVGCRETAAELAQESYLRLLQQGVLAHHGNLPAYLTRIAERLAIDYLRHPANRIRALAEPISEDFPCPRALPEAVAELQELCEILLGALASLPRTCRDVLLLRKLEGLSYTQIGAELGLSEKTVQRRLVKAMLHCHRRLEHPLRHRRAGKR